MSSRDKEQRADDTLDPERMSPAHEFMLNEISMLNNRLEEHVHVEIIKIIDALEGKPEEHLDGTITREGGALKAIKRNSVILEELKDHMDNGGVPARYRFSKGLIAILVAIIGVIGTLGGAVINHNAHTVEQINELRNELMHEIDQVGG